MQKYTHKIGETVVYRSRGIYRITDIKEQKIGGMKRTYYVLSSVYDVNCTVYVPVDSEELTSQIEHVLSVQEVNEIIDRSENADVVWVDNTSERAEYLEEIMKSGDLASILAVLKMFILRRESGDKKGSRSFAHDERVYAAAQKAITEAFAFPLDMDKTQVIPYIREKIM